MQRSFARGLSTVVFAAGSTACSHADAPPATPHHEPDAHHGHHGQGMHHRFEGAESWAKIFDADDRDGWQKPDVVLDAMALTEESLVADVGAGTGYFSVRIAKRVTKGRVYAIDVEADMVRYVGERAKREGATSIIGVQATPDDPKLPEHVDVILIVDTLHHISARDAYFTKLRDGLRPGGRIVVVDFAKDATMGPPPEHRLSADEVVATAERAGLKRVDQRALPQQYVLVFAAR